MTKDVQQAITDILKYIQKYPDAKHTRIGIIKNWIYQQRLGENFQIAEAAIDYLVKDGILEEVDKEDNGSYLRVPQTKISEISFKIIEFKRKNILRSKLTKKLYSVEGDNDFKV